MEENILKKANQKRMLGDMAIEGGNFTTAYFKQQTIRELFDMAPEEPGRREPDREKEKDKEREKEKERDGDVPPDEDEDPAATRRTHILEQVGPCVTPTAPRRHPDAIPRPLMSPMSSLMSPQHLP